MTAVPKESENSFTFPLGSPLKVSASDFVLNKSKSLKPLMKYP